MTPYSTHDTHRQRIGRAIVRRVIRRAQRAAARTLLGPVTLELPDELRLHRLADFAADNGYSLQALEGRRLRMVPVDTATTHAKGASNA